MNKISDLPLELLIEMAISMEIPEILSLCLKDKRFDEKICKNDSFWIYRMKKDFNIPNYSGESPKEFYMFLKDKKDKKEGKEYLSLENSEDGKYFTEDDLLESQLYNEGVLLPTDMQFRNKYETEEEQIENALSDLLYVENDCGYGCKYREMPIGKIVYHGGKSLEETKQIMKDTGTLFPFFVSFNREDAEKYGPVTEYRIVKNYPVRSILWDQLAANYGFECDYEDIKWDSWEEFEDEFDGGRWDKEQKEAEKLAHQVLSKASVIYNVPLVIGSSQDEELGIFPSALDSLE